MPRHLTGPVDTLLQEISGWSGTEVDKDVRFALSNVRQALDAWEAGDIGACVKYAKRYEAINDRYDLRGRARYDQ